MEDHRVSDTVRAMGLRGGFNQRFARRNGKLLYGGVEHLDLEELQGVQGLRALRVQVALDNPKLQERINQGADQWPVRQSTS